MNVAVVDRGQEDVLVVGLRELARWPMHGLIGAVAWRFNGQVLKIVRLPSFDRPSVRRVRA